MGDESNWKQLTDVMKKIIKAGRRNWTTVILLAAWFKPDQV